MHLREGGTESIISIDKKIHKSGKSGTPKICCKTRLKCNVPFYSETLTRFGRSLPQSKFKWYTYCGHIIYMLQVIIPTCVRGEVLTWVHLLDYFRLHIEYQKWKCQFQNNANNPISGQTNHRIYQITDSFLLIHYIMVEYTVTTLVKGHQRKHMWWYGKHKIKDSKNITRYKNDL